MLGHPEVERLLDFSRPVGLVFASVLLYVPDEDDPAGIVSAYLDAMVPGSYLAISTTTADGIASELRPRTQEVRQLYGQVKEPVTARTWDEVAAWFAGTELVEPGLVELPYWPPDPDEQPTTEQTFVYSGAGRLRTESRPD